MQKFIRKPSIDMYPGIKVDKKSTLEYENEHVKQKLEDLTFHTVSVVKGDNYESTYDTTIHLKEGDILIFESEKRGYILPVEGFVTVKDAIKELECIKDI